MVIFLTILASFLALHHINVKCTNIAPPEIQKVQWVAWAYIGEPKIFLRPSYCKKAYNGNIIGLHVLAHEVGHTLGRKTELGADRYADSHLTLLIRKYREQVLSR